MSALLSSTVLACAVCFQADGSATTTGLRVAVATLVLITAGVLAGFGVFISRFVRRELKPGFNSQPAMRPEIRPESASERRKWNPASFNSLEQEP
jgi:hypothetical protein